MVGAHGPGIIEPEVNALPPDKMKILRIIARLNVGGPARHVVWLSEGLKADGYETLLVSGVVPPGEDDMSYVAAASAVPNGRRLRIRAPEILAAVNKFKHYKLATGDLTMDPVNQVPTKEVFLVKMKGKKFTFLTSFTPKYIAKA